MRDNDTQRILDGLHIRPLDGTITGREAARILSWRAKAEHGVDHEYSSASVRYRTHAGHLDPRPQNARFNRYSVEDVFLLPLVPKRGMGRAA